MNIHDYEIWYCKGNKKTGDPIIIKDMKTGDIVSSHSVTMENVNIEMSFNNSVKEPKRSGATTVLKVYKK